MKPSTISKAFIGVVCLINMCCVIANTDPKPLVLNLALVDPGSSITIPGNRNFDFIVIENVVNGYVYSVEIRNEAQVIGAGGDALCLPSYDTKSQLLDTYMVFFNDNI